MRTQNKKENRNQEIGNSESDGERRSQMVAVQWPIEQPTLHEQEDWGF